MSSHLLYQHKTSKRPMKRIMLLLFLAVWMLVSCTDMPLPEVGQAGNESVPQPEPVSVEPTPEPEPEPVSAEPTPEPEPVDAESTPQPEAPIASPYRQYSRDEAVQRLKEHWQYSEVTEENFGMSMLKGPKEVAELFLAAGLSADSKALNGIPVLCIAIMSRQHAIARLLIAEGADVNAPDTNGNSPIAIAVSQCGLLQEQPELNPLVQALIDAGADINVSIGGETIYELANTYKCTEIQETLRKAGAK